MTPRRLHPVTWPRNIPPSARCAARRTPRQPEASISPGLVVRGVPLGVLLRLLGPSRSLHEIDRDRDLGRVARDDSATPGSPLCDAGLTARTGARGEQDTVPKRTSREASPAATRSP